MSIRAKVEVAIGAVLALSTLAVAFVVIEGRFFPPPPPERGGRVELLENWDERSSAARSPVAVAPGSVRVDVFTDFECPFCRVLDSVLQVTESKYPGKFSRSVIHFPLPMHAGARPAAIAFECAARAGYAHQMSSALYRARELSPITLDSLASDVGAHETSAFSDCMRDTSVAVDRINAGLALAADMQVTSTPTVVVNGWILDPALPASVVRAIERAMDGKSPSRYGEKP